MLLGDGGRLGQLLDNLISNALKFTPRGGRVTVRTGRKGKVAFIEVEDTGMGISAADQERLFERFFRTSSATAQAIPGIGLGLAISGAIAEAHGGTIAVSSSSSCAFWPADWESIRGRNCSDGSSRILDSMNILPKR